MSTVAYKVCVNTVYRIWSTEIIDICGVIFYGSVAGYLGVITHRFDLIRQGIDYGSSNFLLFPLTLQCHGQSCICNAFCNGEMQL